MRLEGNGLGPLPFVLMAELFPSALREQGIATTSAVSWLFNALIALTFLSIVEAVTLAGAMLLFLGVCVISLVLGIIFLPETRNLSLETIEGRVLQGLPLRSIGVTGPAADVGKAATPVRET